MTTHYDDEAQAERLKQWWSENWKALAAGLVIGLGAIFGWEGWQRHQVAQATQASRMYEDLKQALATANATEAQAIADRLVTDHASSPYASSAQLHLAAAAVKDGRLDEALQALAWVRNNGTDEGLRQVAVLREARVLWQQGKPDDALKMLERDGGEFAAMYAELKGDILLAKGERSAARAAYEQALDAEAQTDPAPRGDLQRKLDDLADVVQS